MANLNIPGMFRPEGPGGALRYRRGPHLRYVFRGRRGLFLRSPHVRDFVKEGYFFVLRYEVWGSKSLTIHEIYAALMPSDSRNDSGLTSLLPLNKQRIIKS